MWKPKYMWQRNSARNVVKPRYSVKQHSVSAFSESSDYLRVATATQSKKIVPTIRRHRSAVASSSGLDISQQQAQLYQSACVTAIGVIGGSSFSHIEHRSAAQLLQQSLFRIAFRITADTSDYRCDDTMRLRLNSIRSV